MPLTPGTRLGVFEITAQIGEGGMGQVFRATDTTLRRQVAIKILPDAFASDPERMARFEREAKTLASLSHPNIATIYEFEKSGGLHALVMELVEGDDLSQRIARGAVPLDEALPIAKQIAEALEAAHEHGIIHRDLKPANIKVRSDGTVKVLDFGLAKAMEPAAGSSPSMSMSPTITSPAMMTGVGIILGTAAYMSPEQARGRTVDKRTDIWAFGCVLFEMLTGTRAFPGEDVADTLAAVVRAEPDWSRIPHAISPMLLVFLRRCLQKDPKQRVGDIRDVRLALEGAFEVAVPQAAISEVVGRWRRVGVASAVALLTGAVVAGGAVWVATRPAAPVPPGVSRLAVPSSIDSAITVSGSDRDLAITPDGSYIAYVGHNGTQLFIRALNALEPTAAFTGSPRGLFASPDGQWIGFMDNSAVIRKVPVTGGPAVTLARLGVGSFQGATWAGDDAVIFADNNTDTGLQRIGKSGGPKTVLTHPDRAQGELDHLWPEMLPGGRAVLFTITALTGDTADAQIAVMDLETETRKVLMRGGTHAHYVAGRSGPTAGDAREGGYLVYAAAGTLRAVAFDLAALDVRGSSVSVVPDVVTTSFGGVDAVVAEAGTLAYVSGGIASGGRTRTMVWVDRQGQETPIPVPARAYLYPRLSPDGARIAVHSADEGQDLWLWELARATLTRFTFEPQRDWLPLWTPDGRRVIFASERTGARNLFSQAADGTGTATRLTESASSQDATGITPDGTRVVFHEQTQARYRDIRLLTLGPPPHVESLIETPFEERGGVVSPDGRWLAYESNSSGHFEIEVRPFPNVTDGQWQVSRAGGVQPLWARDGRELFYVSPDGALMAVPVGARGATWSVGAASKIVGGRYFTGTTANVSRQYDVSQDGRRFLMLKEGDGADKTAASLQIIVVQHWTEELKRLVPTK